MTEAELLARLYLADRAVAEAAVRALPPGRFARLVRDPARLAPVGALLVLADGTVNAFLKEHAAPLIDLLRRRTRRELRPVGAGSGGIRGRIDWGATLRYRGGSPEVAGDLVCRVPRYDYDQPENQLLVFLLAHLRRCDDVAGRLFGDLYVDDRSKPLGVERLTRTGRLAELWSRLPPPGAITLPPRIGSVHTQAARAAATRHRGYQHLFDVYECVYPLTLEPNAAVWGKALTRSRLKTLAALCALYDEEIIP